MRVRCGVLLLFAMISTASESGQTDVADAPEKVVRRLYTQVVARHPSDIPDDEDLKAFGPYLSHGLVEKFRAAGACMNGWYTKTPGADGKPEVSWTSLRPFVGVPFGADQGDLVDFKVEKSEVEKDGSVRVFLQVTQKTDNGIVTAPVAVVLTRESGPYVVDDVIYEMEHNKDVGDHSEAFVTEMSRLSKYLSVGCDESAKAVQRLFELAISRRPHDITAGQDWTPFVPYLGHALMQKIEAANACSAEWDKQNPYPRLKVLRPSADDLVTTGDGLSDPTGFQLQLVETEKDGSLRMYVVPVGGDQYDPERLAAVVVQEGGRYVVDDVIYLHYVDFRDFPDQTPVYRRLSGYLAAGCEGPHWIKNSLPNDPKALMQSFYKEVVTRGFADVPFGENWKVLAPYFSRGLLHDFRVYDVCEAEVVKANELEEKKEGVPLKVASLAEDTIFGGPGDVAPQEFHVEKAEPQTDGSVRVNLKLMWHDPDAPKKTYTWGLVGVLTQENSHYVLDDVFFLDDEIGGRIEGTLSRRLTNFEECDGGLGPR